MKKVFGIWVLIITLFFNSKAQDSLQARIILIGDAGEFVKTKTPVLTGVKNNIPFDKKTTIIFLGDNLYKKGLPDDATPNYDAIKAPLDSQIIIANGTPAKVYFIPGNHDWDNGKRGGWDAIRREQSYIDGIGDPNVKFYPEDGCPGPVEVHITDDITLLIIDSQWWVHPYDKPGIESDCPFKTKQEVLTQIDDILSKNSKKLVIFAFHHTLKSHGIHGGNFGPLQYIFPLTDVAHGKVWGYIPLPFGPVYPITRSVFGTPEDLAHPAYAQFIADIEGRVKGHKNIIFTSGHEHTLQLLKDSSLFYIVSGSGSKSTRVNKRSNTVFRSPKNGFATLEISKGKNVKASFYTVDSNKIKQEFSENIFNFSTLPTPENPNDTVREVEFAFKDSVVISASDKYKNPSGFRKAFLGTNYRKEWSTPIKLKVFNLKKQNGGFTIISLGGGRQTKSLRLRDKAGKDWTLRSIDKDPEKAIPENLRGTLAQSIVQDMISASNPFAPLIVPSLAKALGVVVSDPKLYFVPDDPAFGFYQKLFANSVCLLEDREPTEDSSDTKSTAKVINKLVDDSKNHIDQPAYLKARLMDNLIGDWDRHFDQWKWGIRDTGKGKLYYPVPRDRDQALFWSNGILLGYTSKVQLKYLQGFKKTIPNVKWFNWEARDIDRIFLNGLDEKQWKNIIDTFQHNITDKVIDNAMKKLPPEIYPIDAAVVSAKLKSRRNILMKEGMTLYKYLSKDVNVIGSNESEYFRVINNPAGLEVRMYKNKNGDSSGILYHRVFNSDVTKEIRLYGLNGMDKFVVDDDANSKIRLRIIGGKGADTFDIKGKVKNYIYDQNTEKNGIINSKKSKIEFSTDPLVNEFKTTGFNYNIYRFPQINLGYNQEDKLLLGFGFSAKTFGFRKDPYSTFQKLSTLYSFNHGAYQFKYQGIFNKVLLNKDIVLNAEMVNPTLNNFFGFGNETKKVPSNSFEFYRVRYKYVQTELLLRKRYNDILNVSVGPAYYHYWNDYEDNKSRILGTPILIGSDSASIFTVKDYLGGRIKIDIDYVNDELLPTRGMTWTNEFTSLYGLNGKSKNLAKITSNMQVFAPISAERKFYSVTRIGYGHISSDNPEYFQTLNIGANNFVRGFRKDRFSGTSMVYASFEVRKRLFVSQSFILPGDVGIVSFFDMGRVWLKGESSHTLHTSGGGGFYYTPFNLVIISATMGFSKEDQLFNFSIGTKFNLTF